MKENIREFIAMCDRQPVVAMVNSLAFLFLLAMIGLCVFSVTGCSSPTPTSINPTTIRMHTAAELKAQAAWINEQRDRRQAHATSNR